MRFTAAVLLAAVAVATAHKPALQPIVVDYEALLEEASPKQHNGGDVVEEEAPPSEGIKTDSSEDIQSEINMTPSVRLTKEMLWEASVPRYDDITQGTLIKTFKLEKDARKWVYKHSGAHWSINYPMPEGINPADNALGSSAALIEMAGSGSGSGSGAAPAAAAVTAAASLPAVDVPLQGAGGAGPEGSGSDASDAGSAAAASSGDDAAAFCADCVKKLGEVNGRIDEIEGKLKAHADAITGITATKGEIVDVSIRRQSNDDAAAAAAAAAAAPAGGSGSAAGSAAEVASASAAPASSAAASSAASAAPAASSAASAAGSAAGSGSADAASSAAAAAPNASFIEKLRTLRSRK